MRSTRPSPSSKARATARLPPGEERIETISAGRGCLRRICCSIANASGWSRASMPMRRPRLHQAQFDRRRHIGLNLARLGDRMRTVNIHAAKTQLSRLVDAAAAGEEIIIAKAGKPAARLGPLIVPGGKRRLGILAGRLRVPEDFDAPLPDEVVEAFEGR